MLLGQKIGKTHGLGQKAFGVAKKIGKVATGASVVGSAILAAKTVGGDQNVRQVGRLLAPGLRGMARNAMM
tara:strand:+ start:440 stop:652 length:213 start_codon:yes stop_codon:yes gene_type:complete